MHKKNMNFVSILIANLIISTFYENVYYICTYVYNSLIWIDIIKISFIFIRINKTNVIYNFCLNYL